MARRPRHQTIGDLGRAPARTPSGRVAVDRASGRDARKPATPSTPPTTPPRARPPSEKPAPAPPPPPAGPPKLDLDQGPERGAIARWLHGALFENVGLKFLSLVLAVTVFLLVNTDRDREISARVGVAYTLPDDKVLISERVEDVHVTIKGPWRKLRGFDERELDRVNIDLRHSTGGEVAITPDMIHVPAGMTVTNITPRFMRVTFDKRVDKLVEVTPALVGRPQHGYVVAEAKVEPPTVRVRGAETMLHALGSVRTRELSLDGRSESFQLDTELVAPDGVELPASDTGKLVTLKVRLEEELVTRKLPGVAVMARAASADTLDTARVKLVPSQVDVTLTGSLLDVEKAKGAIVPVVRVTPADTRARDAEVAIEGLPAGIGVKVSPERVRVVLTSGR